MRIVSFVLTSLLISSIAAADEISDWALRHRLELDTLTSEQAKVKIHDFLVKKVVRKKFVFLGEESHWIHEKWQYRELFISALYDLGFNHILTEMGRADAKKINGYLQTGDESQLKKVCLYGFCSSKPTKKGFVSEEFNFFRSLYKMSASGKRFTHMGFDIDTSPQAGYPDVESALSSVLTSLPGTSPEVVTISRILSKLKRIPNEPMQAESDRVQQAFLDFDQNRNVLKGVFTTPDFNELYWNFRTLAESQDIMNQILGSYGRFVKNPNDQDAKQAFYLGFVNREPKMFARTRYLIESLPANAKFIVLGHNSHMAKFTKGMTVSAFGIMKNQPMWPSIGEWITHQYPGQAYNVWMGLGEGELNDTFGDCAKEVCVAKPIDGTIEKRFLAISKLPLNCFFSIETKSENLVRRLLMPQLI